MPIFQAILQNTLAMKSANHKIYRLIKLKLNQHESTLNHLMSIMLYALMLIIVIVVMAPVIIQMNGLKIFFGDLTNFRFYFGRVSFAYLWSLPFGWSSFFIIFIVVDFLRLSLFIFLASVLLLTIFEGWVWYLWFLNFHKVISMLNK